VTVFQQRQIMQGVVDKIGRLVGDLAAINTFTTSLCMKSMSGDGVAPFV
jgi:hypothetical protein